MDLQMMAYVGGAAVGLVAVGLAVRAVRNAPVIEDDEAATKALRDEWFPPDLQHYWVPAGANGGPDGKWWVFLGAEKTIFGFTDPLKAVEHADRLNQSELRGKYHPGRQSGVMIAAEAAAMNYCGGCQRPTPRDFCPKCGRTFDGGPDDRDRVVQASTPMGYDDHFARRFFEPEPVTIEGVGQQLRLGIKGDDGPLFAIDFEEAEGRVAAAIADDWANPKFDVAAIPGPVMEARVRAGTHDHPGGYYSAEGKNLYFFPSLNAEGKWRHTYTRDRNARAAAKRMNDAEGRIAPAPFVRRTRSA